ncbi:MAG: D-glycero-beta-D-manno-heptose-7-phosphate kinase [Cytophagales bacterium]|nr:MAG: D-glycero-beta-D-manno-heptose-7-phosphate kinase [Cytophagales bacterium]
MIDSYLWGKVERISPEAPVPIVQVQKREKRLGGAANVALNIHALGAKPILCSIIGNDPDGQELIKLLDENNIEKSGIILSNNRITTIKHRILAGHQHLLRIDSEDDSPLDQLDQDQLLEKVKQLITECQVVIFEDYDKGTLSEPIIKNIVNLANQHKIPTIVDPKKRNFLHYKNTTLFKPNLKELKEGLKMEELDPKNIEQLQHAVQKLKQQLSIESAFLTLSEQGVYIDGVHGKHHIPAHLRTIADVSGAGDTVVSVASLALALQLNTKTLATLSNLAGGLVCEHVGVVPIQKELFLKEIKLKYDWKELNTDLI